MFFEDNDLMQIPAAVVGSHTTSTTLDSTLSLRPDSPARKLTDLLSNPTRMMSGGGGALVYEHSPSSNPTSPLSPAAPAYSTSAPSTLYYTTTHHRHHHHHHNVSTSPYPPTTNHLHLHHHHHEHPTTVESSNAIYINNGRGAAEFSLTVPDPSYLSRTYARRKAAGRGRGGGLTSMSPPPPPITSTIGRKKATATRRGLKFATASSPSSSAAAAAAGMSPIAAVTSQLQATNLQNLDERDELNLSDSANSSLKRGGGTATAILFSPSTAAVVDPDQVDALKFPFLSKHSLSLYHKYDNM